MHGNPEVSASQAVEAAGARSEETTLSLFMVMSADMARTAKSGDR